MPGRSKSLKVAQRMLDDNARALMPNGGDIAVEPR